uniref:Uncharacterized protein n=1 Tax=Physcomitrium patens TaxID=3218 RepID=A0A7I4CIN9_PHYPA
MKRILGMIGSLNPWRFVAVVTGFLWRGGFRYIREHKWKEAATAVKDFDERMRSVLYI